MEAGQNGNPELSKSGSAGRGGFAERIPRPPEGRPGRPEGEKALEKTGAFGYTSFWRKGEKEKNGKMRQLLKNAKIYDGTGAEPRRADILLEGDRISRIAENIAEPADRVLDLAGKSVASGFIDGHSHND